MTRPGTEPLIASVPQPGYRRGVGIVLLDPGGRVFVGRRIDQSVEAWQMPQGGIDRGETPREAALRELAEEVGTDKAEVLRESAVWRAYDLPPELARRSWGGRYKGQTQRWFALRFTGADQDIEIATAHPEFADWRWLQPDRLLDLIVPFKRPVYLSVFDEFRSLWA